MLNSKRKFDCAFIAILLGTAFFWLHGLAKPNLTLWDEAININVVKNLANNCCTPMLHRQDFSLDFRGWDNNYIWLHKPLLPFYLNAFFYKLFGQTVLSYRLLGLFCALITIAGIYAIGRKFFSPAEGFFAALIFASNPYMLSLVHELQFSGFVDLNFLCALVWSLYFLLDITQNPSRKNFLWFAFFGSLAFLCKNGLAFGPFVALVFLCFRLGFKNTFKNLLYAALLTTIIIAPEMVLLARLFPAQFAYEQSQYLQGFVANVEYSARPWDYYLSFYFNSIIGILLAGISWLAVFFGIYKAKKNLKIFVLLAWIFSYLAVLTLQVSKISNFLVPILPPLSLLTAAGVFYFLKNQGYRLLSSVGAATLLFYFALRYNVLNIKSLAVNEQTILFRFLPVWLYLILLAGAYLFFLLVKNQQRLKPAAYFFTGLATAIITLTGLRTGWKLAATSPADSDLQTAIQNSVLPLQKRLPENSVLLTQTDKIRDDHLYFMYWTGFDSIEIRQYQPLSLLSELVPKNQHVYVISDVQEDNTKNIGLTYEFTVPFGYVYKLR